jgi:hypothetical protein
MRIPSTSLRLTAAISVFLLLTYFLYEFDGGLRFVGQTFRQGVEAFFIDEVSNYRLDLYKLCTFVIDALVITPPLLAAIFTYIALTKDKLTVSLRGLFIATLAIAMFLAFGEGNEDVLYLKAQYEGNDTRGYVSGLGYMFLLLLITWVSFQGIRKLETSYQRD